MPLGQPWPRWQKAFVQAGGEAEAEADADAHHCFDDR
jgi:hypothetical protein